MRRLGPFVNAVFCTVIGVMAAQSGVRIMIELCAALMDSLITHNDGLGMALGLVIWFVARSVVAATTSIASAYLFARRWTILGKWSISAMLSAILSVAISLKWAAYELSINRFWP